MGRGNVRIGEAIYYVDYDKFTCYFPDENGEDTEERDYECEIDYQKDFIMNVETAPNFLEHFNITPKKEWIDNDTKALAENEYYIVVVVDNEWSMGFALVRKDFYEIHSIYDFDTEQEEKEAYDSFMIEQDALLSKSKNILLNVLFEFTSEVYVPNGAWTSSKITKETIEGEANAG